MSEPLEKQLKRLEKELEEIRKKKMVAEEPIEEEPYKKKLKQIGQIFKGTETTFKKSPDFITSMFKKYKVTDESLKSHFKAEYTRLLLDKYEDYGIKKERSKATDLKKALEIAYKLRGLTNKAEEEVKEEIEKKIKEEMENQSEKKPDDGECAIRSHARGFSPPPKITEQLEKILKK